MMADFTRLPARICSTVNSPPQTLHCQLGEAAGALIDSNCRSVRLALTSSLPHCGQSRSVISSCRRSDVTRSAPVRDRRHSRLRLAVPGSRAFHNSSRALVPPRTPKFAGACGSSSTSRVQNCDLLPVSTSRPREQMCPSIESFARGGPRDIGSRRCSCKWRWRCRHRSAR